MFSGGPKPNILSITCSRILLTEPTLHSYHDGRCVCTAPGYLERAEASVGSTPYGEHGGAFELEQPPGQRCADQSP